MEKKKWVRGTFRIGDVMLRNQFGVMGKNLRNKRKKNRLFLFSCTFSCSIASFSGNRRTTNCLPYALESRKQKVAPMAVKTQHKARPSHGPNNAPANIFKKDEPGIANVCL